MNEERIGIMKRYSTTKMFEHARIADTKRMNMNKPQAYEGNEPYIFVSYSHKNQDFVWPVIQEMNDSGYRVWYDDGIHPGDEWPTTIANHIFHCSFAFAFVTEDYINSINCKRELLFADNKKKNIILVHAADFALPVGMEMQYCLNQAIVLAKGETRVDLLRQIGRVEGIQCTNAGASAVKATPHETEPHTDADALVALKAQEAAVKRKIEDLEATANTLISRQTSLESIQGQVNDLISAETKLRNSLFHSADHELATLYPKQIPERLQEDAKSLSAINYALERIRTEVLEIQRQIDTEQRRLTEINKQAAELIQRLYTANAEETRRAAAAERAKAAEQARKAAETRRAETARETANTESIKAKRQLIKAAIDASCGSKYAILSYGAQNGRAIVWHVLKYDGVSLFVMSEQIIAAQPWSVTHLSNPHWETSSLRKWLNSTFLSNAFSETERNRIKRSCYEIQNSRGEPTQVADTITLLNRAEAEKYLPPSNRKAYSLYSTSASAWWLRDLGDSDYCAMAINDSGSINTSGLNVGLKQVGVRPVMKINISDLKADIDASIH